MEKMGKTGIEEHLQKGSKVEIFSQEDGFQNSWFPAVILRPPYSHTSQEKKKKKKKRKRSSASDSKAFIQYENFLTVRTHKLLTGYVDVSSIRPLPPPEAPQQVIELNDVVDALHRDVWWTGVVINVVGNKYYVKFKFPPDILELDRSQIRLHLDWVKGVWSRPEKQETTTGSSLFSPGEAIEVNLDNELPCNVWSSAIFLGEVCPNYFLVQTKNSKIGEDGLHKITVELHQIRPHPPQVEVKFGLFEKVDAFDGLCWWVGVIAKVLIDGRYTVTSMRAKEVKEYDGSELRPHLEWVEGRWDTKPMNVTNGPDCIPQYPHACNSTKDFLLATRNESSGARMENAGEETSCSTNKGDSHKEQNNGGVSNAIQGKGEEDKLPIASGQAAAVGEEQNGVGVITVDCTTDKVELPMTALIEVSGDQLNGAAGVEDCGTDKSELTLAVRGSEDVLRDVKALVSATDCSTEDVMLVDMDGISSNSISDNQPLLVPINEMPINEIHPIENADDSGPTGYIEQNSGLSLPFVKTFSIWQRIESMEVFRKLPQNPHFQPLVKSKEVYREGLAIGYMLAFVSMVEMIANLEIDTPGEFFNDATETLAEMEKMGFNVEALRGRLSELQLVQVKLRQLEDESEGIKNKIIESTHDKTQTNEEVDELLQEMKKLEEEKARLITKTVAINTDLDMLQSEDAVIIEEILRVKQKFLVLRQV
ncbi:hypothetical protein FEM48_Zijuj03G0124200 [Ziziphus jujuba var. spinosa]|uniref:Agenet domain-containing protein n=1 Tax=Ziziphus jujuba var. spinosa TaxID=714518 RepID=A0A978VQA8_ZIZJJ|nr:hypothetical protein FEM48_Zijuj03G0124200 [Ziziphus jujuba var. spinosa]